MSLFATREENPCEHVKQKQAGMKGRETVHARETVHLPNLSRKGNHACTFNLLA